jgi:hypothetical protein
MENKRVKTVNTTKLSPVLVSVTSFKAKRSSSGQNTSKHKSLHKIKSKISYFSHD